MITSYVKEKIPVFKIHLTLAEVIIADANVMLKDGEESMTVVLNKEITVTTTTKDFMEDTITSEMVTDIVMTDHSQRIVGVKKIVDVDADVVVRKLTETTITAFC